MTTSAGRMGSPKVSVIVPCYNLGQYIDEAVDSVLAQTCQDFEIIIVNDGSTDAATNERLHDYPHPRTRVIATENRGLAAARNLGITVARGAYVCALDADDRLAPTYLEKATRILDADPSVAFVSSWLETFGDESWVWKQERCDLPTLLGECTVCTAALVRIAALHDIGGYDEAMPEQGYEDWDLWISLVERGFRGVIIPEVLFHYRQRAGSMSSICCSGEAHLKLMRYLVEKHEASYQQHLLEVLLRRDGEVADLLRSNAELERHIDTWLVPEVARRREELEALRQKAEAERERRIAHERVEELERARAADQAQLQEVTAALARTRDEVAAVRESKSWKATAPLRALYGWLDRLTGGSRG
jgi:GT2 family glycosyltransferase